MEPNKIYQYVLNSIKDGVYFVDKDRKITFWNKSAERITGFSSKEVNGRHCFDNILNHVDAQGTFLCHNGCPLHQTLEDGQERTSTVYLQHKDGHRVETTVYIVPIVENGEIIGAVETFDEKLNLSMVEKNMDQLRTLAYFDQLTGLPNRRYLDEHIEMKLTGLKNMGANFAMAIIDIDHFKVVNDTYGHDVGDEVLVALAKLLKAAVRGFDFIGRWGGEEFLAIFDVDDIDKFYQTLQRLRMMVAFSALKTHNPPIQVTISIGGALASPGDDGESLFKKVDDMLYKSKNNGRNCVHIAPID